MRCLGKRFHQLRRQRPFRRLGRKARRVTTGQVRVGEQECLPQAIVAISAAGFFLALRGQTDRVAFALQQSVLLRMSQ